MSEKKTSRKIEAVEFAVIYPVHFSIPAKELKKKIGATQEEILDENLDGNRSGEIRGKILDLADNLFYTSSIEPTITVADIKYTDGTEEGIDNLID